MSQLERVITDRVSQLDKVIADRVTQLERVIADRVSQLETVIDQDACHWLLDGVSVFASLHLLNICHVISTWRPS